MFEGFGQFNFKIRMEKCHHTTSRTIVKICHGNQKFIEVPLGMTPESVKIVVLEHQLPL